MFEAQPARKSRFKRLLFSLLRMSLMLYVGLFVCAQMFVDKIIFQPRPASYRDTDRIIKLDVGGDTRISAIYLANPQAAYTILYSHGNGEDIGMTLPLLEATREMGFSVFAYDYRGYGTSGGAPSEANAYADVEAAYNYMTGELKIPPAHIIALGRSLGGAVAVDLAARKPLGGLIIESSFVSAFRVVTNVPIFPFDRFRSLSKIKSVSCPVLVMHGTNDEVIPFRHGEKLFERANAPKLSLWIDKARHNDLFEIAGARYRQALQDFIKLIENNGQVG